MEREVRQRLSLLSVGCRASDRPDEEAVHGAPFRAACQARALAAAAALCPPSTAAHHGRGDERIAVAVAADPAAHPEERRHRDDVTLRDMDGRPSYPTTASMIPELEQALFVIPAIVVIIYAGELVWNERARRMHEIVDQFVDRADRFPPEAGDVAE